MKGKNKNKNKLIVFLGIIIILLIIIIFILLIKKGIPLNQNNKDVVEAYSYISNKSLEKCNGLVMYDNKKVTQDTLENTTKICMSYNLLETNKEEVVLEKNENDGTCNLTEDMVFAVDDYEGDVCTVSKVSKSDVHKNYKRIFGSEPETDESFTLDNVTVCYYNEGYYYCGLSEKYTYIFGAEPHTYRTIKSAYKKDDKLIIYDYFLRIINDECYTSYMSTDKNDICSKKYDSNEEMEFNFMRKYATVYKHIFQKNGDSYYWVSSEAN